MSVKDMFYPEDKEFSRVEQRIYAREELIYNVTEDILIALEDAGVSKKELARRLSKSRSYVTQILSGARNMTLGSLSDICFALDIKPRVIFPNQEGQAEQVGQLALEALNAWHEMLSSSGGLTPKEYVVNEQTANVIHCEDEPRWKKAA